MSTIHSSLLARPDTFLGVCEALGEDLRFNPLWLRIAFGVALLWSPVAVIATYLGAGVIVALTRLLYPSRVRVAKRGAAAPAATEAPRAENDAVAFAEAA